MSRWKKPQRSHYPKIEECSGLLRSALENELQAQIEKWKHKHGRRSIPDCVRRGLVRVAKRMLFWTKEERSAHSRRIVAQMNGRRSVLRRKQYGIFESQLARARAVHIGWCEFRKRE